MPSYFNVFKCGNKLLNRLDMPYERACTANPREEYHTNILDTLVNYNEHNNGPLSNKSIQQAIRRVVSETEEQERDAERNANHVTMDTIPNISNMSRPTLDSTPIGLKNHCNISTSQGEI